MVLETRHLTIEVWHTHSSEFGVPNSRLKKCNELWVLSISPIKSDRTSPCILNSKLNYSVSYRFPVYYYYYLYI